MANISIGLLIYTIRLKHIVCFHFYSPPLLTGHPEATQSSQYYTGWFFFNWTPLNFLCTRSNVSWCRIFVSASAYKGILYFENLGREGVPVKKNLPVGIRFSYNAFPNTLYPSHPFTSLILWLYSTIQIKFWWLPQYHLGYELGLLN